MLKQCSSIALAIEKNRGDKKRELHADANASEGEPSWGQMMSVVRTELTLGDKDETARSGHILKRDFKNIPPTDVIDACRGTRKLIDAGKVDGIEHGQPVGLRFLRKWYAEDGRLLWDAAIEHERVTDESSGPRGTRPERVKVDVA